MPKASPSPHLYRAARATQPLAQDSRTSLTEVKPEPEASGSLHRSQRSDGVNPAVSAVELQKCSRENIDRMMAVIRDLERHKKQYKTQLQMRKENMKDTKAELEAARTECVLLEERVEDMEEVVRQLLVDMHRYRRWWLTEYYSLQALLGLIPDKKSVEAIAFAAHERFKFYNAAV